MSRYETDLSDEQWALIAPLLPPAKFGGRPRTTDLRRVVDASLYLLKTGCQWRNLPSDFPPWRTVYEYFARWHKERVWARIHKRLFVAVRKHAGRNSYPSAVIIDSQSVKTGKMGGERGYDGGKRVKGRKRHIIADTLGFPMAITVTPANVHDQTGGVRALGHLERFMGGRSFKRLYADGGYQGKPFKRFVRKTFSAAVRISLNLAKWSKTFIPVSQRWVIERTFSWLYDYRRLTVDYERTIASSRAMIRLAAINLILNRLSPKVSSAV